MLARTMFRVLGLAAVAVCAGGSTCNGDAEGPSGPTTPAGSRSRAPTLESGCPEGQPLAALDLNRDGRPDFAVFPEGDGTCRAADLNFDGHDDLFRHRDAAGNLLREEADGDHDFHPDSAALYAGAPAPYREEFDTNWDGLVDLWVELQRDCVFARGGSAECTTECAIDWCGPRTPLPSQDPDAPPPEPVPPPSSISVLYRDGNADGIWDTSEVLYGEHPICVAFNTNVPGDSAQTVHPEVVEVYKPAMAMTGRPEIDYLRRDYLDLNGNPIVRCEDSDGAVVACPSTCAR
ncbi:MAG: hypothetical protein HY907_13030 [Deltaproteobacteria bacterium]|nr:hypothetical protein [Deltaproteobacteria bacterium]